MGYAIQRYTPRLAELWNDFVAKSKNGTFLFHRDFMDYHSDRFEDYSLTIFDGEKLVAIFPANRKHAEVHSHQGLTYGGLILLGNPGGEKVEVMLKALLAHLKGDGIETLYIKQIPQIYFRDPAFETDYFLMKEGGELYRRDMNLAIDYSKPLSVGKSKMKRFRQVRDGELEVLVDNNFELFWDNVLIPRLAEKHSTKPVHTKEEIMLLHARFPQNILQYNIYKDERILAGITLFDFGNVVKSQYGATTPEGERVRALDYLFITLIQQYKSKATYFDMGVVTEGHSFNSGLLKQKEELGCSIYLHDYYKLML